MLQISFMGKTGTFQKRLLLYLKYCMLELWVIISKVGSQEWWEPVLQFLHGPLAKNIAINMHLASDIALTLHMVIPFNLP